MGRHPAFRQDDCNATTCKREIVVYEVQDLLTIDKTDNSATNNLQREVVGLSQFPFERRLGENMLTIERFYELDASASAEEQGVVSLHPLDSSGDTACNNEVRSHRRFDAIVGPFPTACDPANQCPRSARGGNGSPQSCAGARSRRTPTGPSNFCLPSDGKSPREMPSQVKVSR